MDFKQNLERNCAGASMPLTLPNMGRTTHTVPQLSPKNSAATELDLAMHTPTRLGFFETKRQVFRSAKFPFYNTS